jgi:hypothetical protein
MSYQYRNAQRAKSHIGDVPRWQVDRDTERGPCFNHCGNGFTTVNVLQAFCEVNNRELDFASTYGEPGYSDPEKSILFTDWNDIPKKLQTRLEAQGYELEWSDEWYIDHNNNGKAYRTSPDSYGWESRLMFSEAAGDYLTPDDGLEDWIAQCQDDARSALPSWWSESDIAALGWVKQTEDYESGFHPGQNDDPKQIATKLRAERKTFLFQIGGVGQFDIRFHVWVLAEETETSEESESEQSV